MATLETALDAFLSENVDDCLLSLVFEICPTKDYATERTTGHNAHAAFLELVEDMDHDLGRLLHADRDTKPFTLSWLQGPFVFEGGYRWLKAGERYWFRATGFSSEISRFLLSCLREPPAAVHLFREEIPVTRVIASGHAAAGADTFRGLYDRAMNGSETPRHLTLRFLTPTAFRSGKRNILFPLPGLVFRILSKKWNAYAPVHLGDLVHRMIDETVSVSHYRLRTRILDFGDYRQLGFVGDAGFSINKDLPDLWARVIQLLADFAFYAGVGYKTTMGMGQVRSIRAATGQ